MSSPSNNLTGIDPIQYGMLLASVESLKAQQAEMKRDMDTRLETMAGQIADLLELANKSKGGFWMGMSLAAAAGSIATWVLKEIGGKGP